MNTEPEKSESTNSSDESGRTSEEAASDEGEFKIAVRKLDMPVRPRGVLAE
jgi:hypothetical protein